MVIPRKYFSFRRLSDYYFIFCCQWVFSEDSHQLGKYKISFMGINSRNMLNKFWNVRTKWKLECYTDMIDQLTNWWLINSVKSRVQFFFFFLTKWWSWKLQFMGKRDSVNAFPILKKDIFTSCPKGSCCNDFKVFF